MVLLNSGHMWESVSSSLDLLESSLHQTFQFYPGRCRLALNGFLVEKYLGTNDLNRINVKICTYVYSNHNGILCICAEFIHRERPSNHTVETELTLKVSKRVYAHKGVCSQGFHGSCANYFQVYP